jgi:predicted Zn-ribbon and HTH transcriptional regulator
MGMRRLERIVMQGQSGAVSKRPHNVRACRLCGHVWESRKEGGEPKNCPKCRTSLWDNRKVELVACRRCGHTWATTIAHPSKCPSCGSKRWDVESLTVVCVKCGCRWNSSFRNGEAVCCPKCGELEPEGYRVDSARRSRGRSHEGASLSEGMLKAMWEMDDDLERALLLRNNGLTPEQADAIVSFDRGASVPDIAARMSMPVCEVMDAVLPFMSLCESLGAKSWS